MQKGLKNSILAIVNNKISLTLWMNHLVIIYAFLLPISQYANSFIFFLILTLFILRRNFKEYLTPVFTNKVVQSFILFFSIHIIWLLGTDNFHQAALAIELVQYSLYSIIFLSFIDKRISYYIIGTFIGGILCSELVSYAIQFSILPWKLTLASIPIYEAFSINDPSPFLHHSYYATSLAFVSALLIYKSLIRKLTFIEKVISIFFITSISINLSLVGGRIGYILYILLILFLIIYIYRKTLLKPLLIISIAVGMFFSLAYKFSPIFSNRIEQTRKEVQSVIQEMDFTTPLGGRIGFAYYASDVIKENPIFGIGTGDYMDNVRQIIPETSNNYFIKYTLAHPHNIYIMLLLQFGIVGFIAFLNIFYQIYRQKTTDDYLRFVKYTMMIAFATALMTEIFAYYLPLFVLIISTTLATTQLPKKFTLKFSKNIYISYILLILLATINAKLHFVITVLKNQL